MLRGQDPVTGAAARRWSDTRGLTRTHPGNQHLVVYDDVTQKRGMLTGINVSITGCNAALGDTTGFRPPTLPA